MILWYRAWLYNVFVSGILRNAGFFFRHVGMVLADSVDEGNLCSSLELDPQPDTEPPQRIWAFASGMHVCDIHGVNHWVFGVFLYIDSFWRNITVPAPSLDSSPCLLWCSRVIPTVTPHQVSAVAPVAEVHTCLLGLPPSSLPQLPHLCSQRQSKHCETAKWNLSTVT